MKQPARQDATHEHEHRGVDAGRVPSERRLLGDRLRQHACEALGRELGERVIEGFDDYADGGKKRTYQLDLALQRGQNLKPTPAFVKNRAD